MECLEEEIQLWESLAIEDVATAKTMENIEIIFLLCCIDTVRKAISEENSYSIPAFDIRYRAYVIKVLSESKQQELPNWDKLFIKILTGKN
ncbi:MAG: hypothetical protein LBN27_12120 [Prevotellaceae bacterium]|jgi:hypothetical protein|nr:hypothetical protein [Prevotellaceae bacterium]